MRALIAGMVLATTLARPAQADDEVRIGVLNDQSSIFAEIGGIEVVKAVELAIADFGGTALGKPVTLVAADHANDEEVGLAVARRWLEKDSVDAIADMTNSDIALGVNRLLGEYGKVGLFVSPLTDRPTEEDCNGHVVAWAYDADSTIRATVTALFAEGDSAFFILSTDSEAGALQEEAVEAAVMAAGGTVTGKMRLPLGTTDFAASLHTAEGSGADAIIMNISGADLVAAMGQVQEHARDLDVAVTFMHQADVRAIGIEALQGVRFVTPWFWGKDEASRAWGRRVMAITGHAPGWISAGTYSAVSHYLAAVEKAGTDDAAAVLDALDAMEIADFFVSNGELYPNGRLIHDMYLVEVKAPGEITETDDLLKLVSVVPATVAFTPYAGSDCRLP